tara:strand:- start:385 stop:579 length:195 start_codon:yes stop_codon:yes gene_type:complete
MEENKMSDIKDILKLSKNDFLFVNVKNRNKKEIPILDMDEDIENIDDDLNNQINRHGSIRIEEI